MRTKKIITTLLVIGVIGSGFLGYKTYVKADSENNIQEEVVYTSGNSSDDYKDSYKIKDDEAEEYKELSKQVLKRYFDIQDNEFNDFDESKVRVSRVNEKTITDMQLTLKKNIQEAYANNKISKEEYEKEMEYCNGGPKDPYEANKKALKHNTIAIRWINTNKCYDVSINEKTNEIDGVTCYFDEEDGVKLDISKEELKNTADKFITDKNLGSLENLNFDGIEESGQKGMDGTEFRHFYKATYTDKEDSNKKISLEINMYTGKVQAFYFD